MITEKDFRLITAAVDEELSPAEWIQFHQLLQKQPEARHRYSELCQHRDRLRNLARQPAPAWFQRQLLSQLTPYSPASHRPSQRFRPRFAEPRIFAASAIAASLFLVVASASFWFTFETTTLPAESNFNASLASQSNPPGDAKPLSYQVPRSNVDRMTPLPRPNPRQETVPEPADLPRLPRVQAEELALQDQPEQAPMPRSPAASFIGAAVRTPAPPLAMVEVRLPFFAPVVDLDRPDVIAELTQQFSQSRAIRLDLFATDTVIASNIVVKAARAQGITVDIDSLTGERLKKKLPIGTLLVCETVSAPEFLELLARLARDARESSSHVLTDGHCFSATAADYKELRDLFGVDLEFDKAAVAKQPGRSITAGTVTELTEALRPAGQRKRPERSGILLTHLPAAIRVPPSASKELRRFLEERRPRKVDDLPFMIVVRPTAMSVDR